MTFMCQCLWAFCFERTIFFKALNLFKLLISFRSVLVPIIVLGIGLGIGFWCVKYRRGKQLYISTLNSPIHVLAIVP